MTVTAIRPTSAGGTRTRPRVRSRIRPRGYSVAVHSWSDISFTASARQDEFCPGARVWLVATLDESGMRTTGDVSIWAEITRPNGVTVAVPFDAAHGEFVGSFVASLSGDYAIRVRAWGTSGGGSPYERECTLTAGVRRALPLAG